MQTRDRLQNVPRARPPLHPYAQIAARYRARIRAQKLKPGDPFPPMSKIAKEWGVSIPTAQRAVNLLRQEGWVRVVNGTGTFVADDPPP